MEIKKKSCNYFVMQTFFFLFYTCLSIRCFFSIWMFVTSYCQNMCGVFYHIDPHNNYATPTVLLTSTGPHTTVLFTYS